MTELPSLIHMPPIAASMMTAVALIIVVLLAGVWIMRDVPRKCAQVLLLLAGLTIAAKAGVLAYTRSQYEPEVKQAEYLPREFWERAVLDGPSVYADDVGFATLSVLSTPFFYAFGAHDTIPPAVNNAAIALAALIMAGAFARFSSTRMAVAVFLLVAWNPSAVYWGLFGLRDPLIYLGSALAAAGVLYLIPGASANPWRAFRLILAAGVCAVLLRPEVALIPFVAMGLAAFLIPLSVRFRTLSVAAALCGLAVVVPLMMDEIGVNAFSVEQFNNFTAARLSRSIEFQNESLYFDTVEQIRSAPGSERLSTQVVGIVLCPFPVMPRGISDWLVFGESLAWVALLAMPFVLRAARDQTAALRAARALALTAFLGLLAYSPFLVNAGNAFRMRFSMLPLAAAGATLAVAVKRTNAARATHYPEATCTA